MRTLVAGFGNVLMQDDGFGVEVVRKLASSSLCPEAELLDVGIGGMHLVARLHDRYDRLILVDAMQGEGEPGQLYVQRLDPASQAQPFIQSISPHFTEPSRALLLAARLQLLPPIINLIGCQPESCEMTVGLTAAVAAGAERAAGMIRLMLGVADDADAAPLLDPSPPGI